MAHHGNTPQSVLDAPQQTFVQAYANERRNRRDRRHFRPKQNGAEMPPLLRFKPMLPAEMQPAQMVSNDKRPRRGKKARKYGGESHTQDARRTARAAGPGA